REMETMIEKFGHFRARYPRTCAASAALALVLMSLPTTAAPLPSYRERVEVEESSEPGNVFTLKLAALEVVSPVEEGEEGLDPEKPHAAPHGSEAVAHVGVSFSFERTLIGGCLAPQLNVLLSPGEGGATVPA